VEGRQPEQRGGQRVERRENKVVTVPQMCSLVGQHRLQLGMLQPLKSPAAHHDRASTCWNAVNNGHRMIQNTDIVQLAGDLDDELQGLLVPAPPRDRSPVSRYDYPDRCDGPTEHESVEHVEGGTAHSIAEVRAVLQPLRGQVHNAVSPR
jgi:hypothetical protein